MQPIFKYVIVNTITLFSHRTTHSSLQHLSSEDKINYCRIQQIQLLGRDLKGAEHDRLWNQLEAEIHLHRHKTVIR